jgi:hypothetical protein
MSANSPPLQEVVGRGGGGQGSIDAEFTVARQQKIHQKVIRKLSRILAQIASLSHLYPYPLNVFTRLKFKCTVSFSILSPLSL